MGKNKGWTNLVLILLSPVLLLIIVISLIFLWVSYLFKLIYDRWLRYRFWNRHGRFGRFVLFTYSDSPNWKDYIEANILPRINDHTVTLNWSERRKWESKNPLEAKIFYRWAGKTEFNPIALIIPESGKVKRVRFWQAFRDFKHGKATPLKKAEELLFDEVVKHSRIPGRASDISL